MPIFKLSHVNRVYDASHIHGQASGPAVEPASPLRRDISEDEDDADSSSGSEVTSDDGSFTTVGPSVVGNSAAMQISTQVGADLRPLIAHHLSSSGVIEDSITPDDSISRVGGRAPSSLAGKSEVLKSKGRVPLSSLGATEVANLLHSIDLGRYATNFLSLPWRGADLEAAEERDLEDAGVAAPVHRRSLLKQVAVWRVEGVPMTSIRFAPTDEGGGGSSGSEHSSQHPHVHTPPVTITLTPSNSGYGSTAYGSPPSASFLSEIRSSVSSGHGSSGYAASGYGSGQGSSGYGSTHGFSPHIHGHSSHACDGSTANGANAPPSSTSSSSPPTKPATLLTAQPGIGGGVTLERVELINGSTAEGSAEASRLIDAGHAANAAGDVSEARRCFRLAYELTRKVSPQISAANMLMRLGEPRQALAEYEALLLRPDLTEAHRRGVHRKISDAMALASSLEALNEALGGAAPAPTGGLADDDGGGVIGGGGRGGGGGGGGDISAEPSETGCQVLPELVADEMMDGPPRTLLEAIEQAAEVAMRADGDITGATDGLVDLDATSLAAAINACRSAGAPAKLMEKAEASLAVARRRAAEHAAKAAEERARKDAEERSKRAAEAELNAAMPRWFGRPSSERLANAIDKARAARVEAHLIAGAEATLRQVRADEEEQAKIEIVHALNGAMPSFFRPIASTPQSIASLQAAIARAKAAGGISESMISTAEAEEARMRKEVAVSEAARRRSEDEAVARANALSKRREAAVRLQAHTRRRVALKRFESLLREHRAQQMRRQWDSSQQQQTQQQRQQQQQLIRALDDGLGKGEEQCMVEAEAEAEALRAALAQARAEVEEARRLAIVESSARRQAEREAAEARKHGSFFSSVVTPLSTRTSTFSSSAVAATSPICHLAVVAAHVVGRWPKAIGRLAQWRSPRRHQTLMAFACCVLFLSLVGSFARRLPRGAASPPPALPRYYRQTETWRRRPSWMLPRAHQELHLAAGDDADGFSFSDTSSAPGWWRPAVHAMRGGLGEKRTGSDGLGLAAKDGAVAGGGGGPVSWLRRLASVGGRRVAERAEGAARSVPRWLQRLGAQLQAARRKMVDVVVEVEESEWPRFSWLTPRAECVSRSGLPLSRGSGCVRM